MLKAALTSSGHAETCHWCKTQAYSAVKLEAAPMRLTTARLPFCSNQCYSNYNNHAQSTRSSGRCVNCHRAVVGGSSPDPEGQFCSGECMFSFQFRVQARREKRAARCRVDTKAGAVKTPIRKVGGRTRVLQIPASLTHGPSDMMFDCE